MLSTELFEQRISLYDQAELLSLWEAIEKGDTPDWEPGKAFEYLVLRAFQLEGADVRWPYRVEMDGEEIEQIDGVVYCDGMSFLIECKDSGSKINADAIAKLRFQLMRRPVAAMGMVFSRSGFTEPALLLIRHIAPQTILLWSGEEVGYALKKGRFRKYLLAKYKECLECGMRNFKISGD